MFESAIVHPVVRIAILAVLVVWGVTVLAAAAILLAGLVASIRERGVIRSISGGHLYSRHW